MTNNVSHVATLNAPSSLRSCAPTRDILAFPKIVILAPKGCRGTGFFNGSTCVEARHIGAMSRGKSASCIAFEVRCRSLVVAEDLGLYYGLEHMQHGVVRDLEMELRGMLGTEDCREYRRLRRHLTARLVGSSCAFSTRSYGHLLGIWLIDLGSYGAKE